MVNGIHDMGGMEGFGPVRPETGEPVFHADWERRVFAMGIAGIAFFGPVDRIRHAIERIDPARYLSTSYYEHWLAGLEMLGVELGYIDADEIASGQVTFRKQTAYPPPDAAMIESLIRHGAPATRAAGRQLARFKLGDQVRARNLEIPGHTRLPRYARGKPGLIVALRGTHAFPDTAAHDKGESPQPLYTVRFEARTLWGDNVVRQDCVYLDLWEDYLELLEGTR